MSVILKSKISLPAPAIVGAISDAEAAVGRINPHMWLSARDRVPGSRTHRWRDRVRQSVWASQGGVYPGTLSSRPVLRFNSGGSAWLLADYQLPPSYGIFVLANINGYTSTGAGCRLFASADTSGNRMWLQVTTAGVFSLAHGVVECNVPGVVALSTTFAGWASYDTADKSAAGAKNTVSIQATQTMAVDHKGQQQSVIGGYSNSANLNGYIEELIIFDIPMHKADHDSKRAAVMTYLAGRAGITLS